jgi:DNA-binding NarL/FixJ family response regulator/class 3 adenylate cyclase
MEGMRGTGTVTLLFTDLVGSTRLLSELGDDATEAVRRRHFGLLRESITRHHGREVKNLGDGVMAVFDSAVDAVTCAVRIQRHTDASEEAHALAVRVGLHVGEPMRDGDDYFGIPVVVAKRLCDAADGGQILASDIVRALVQPRGTIEFSSAGSAELKGVTGAVEVFAVDWQRVEGQRDESQGALRPRLRVLIADDHPVFRDGLSTLLDPVAHIEVVGLATNGREAIEAALALDPDVVVMDLQMPELNGIDATRQLISERPDMGVLVLTMFEDDDSVFAAMRAGARGYVLKGASQAKIVQAIEVIAGGEAIFGPSIAQKMIALFTTAERPPQPFPDLTEREREVLDMIAGGLGNQEITSRLVVSPKTVRNHVSNIFAKLQVSDRPQAIVRAREAGLGQRTGTGER